MPSLYIAANLIENIALSGAAHLQFVYGDVGNLQELEVQAGPDLLNRPWDFVGVRSHGGVTTVADGSIINHTSYIGPGDIITNNQRYVRILSPLDAEQTAENVWELLQKANMAIQQSLLSLGTEINYDANQNSNSFVRTLLDIVGIDIGDVDTVFDTDEIGSYVISTFAGFGRNVLNEAEVGGFRGPHVALSLDLEGTAGNDTLDGGSGTDTAIFSGNLSEYVG